MQKKENLKLGYFVWQQDGAPPHRAVADLIKPLVPCMLEWPARSPDLSPIEQIWSYLKHQLRGKTFATQDALFSALETEWNNMPVELVHNFWESYWARCKVCLYHHGAPLNGKWKEVHTIHDQYRQKTGR